MLPLATNLQSIGKQLMAARVERGLAVEDVAFKTYIPAAKIRELENDDFSNFANLTYAKGFLKIYSHYLDLDLSDYLDEFNTSEFANISGHDYIQSANTGLTSLSMAVAPDDRSGRGTALIGIILVALAIIIVPIWYWGRAHKDEDVPTPPPAVDNGPAPKARIIPDPPAPAPAATIPSTSAPTSASVPVPQGSLPKPKVEERPATPVLRKPLPEDPEPVVTDGVSPSVPPPATVKTPD